MNGLSVYRFVPRPCPHDKAGRPHRSFRSLLACLRRNGNPGFRSVPWNGYPGTYPRVRRYQLKLRQELREAFGNYCGAGAPVGVGCGTNGGTPLEWAHVYPTGVSGQGRGRFRRLSDVRRNPFAYCQLCRPCHEEFDRDEEGRSWRRRR